MDERETLSKAIKKAIENGWTEHKELPSGLHGINGGKFSMNHFDMGTFAKLFYRPPHKFAKALWGERKVLNLQNHPYINVHKGDTLYDSESGWQYHLQQMVVADDPIKYLGKNL